MIRNIPVNHYLCFAIEMLVGLSGFIAIYLFGEAGSFVFVFFVTVAFLKKKKPDEREIYLLYKTATFTFALFFLTMVFLYPFPPQINYLYAMGFSALFWHGLVGTVVFSLE